MRPEQRRYPRVVVALGSTVKTARMQWRGTTVDLNPYGVKLAFGAQALELAPQTKIRLQLALPDQAPPLSVTASVVRLDHDGIALSFVNLEEEHFQRLKAVVDSLCAEPGKGLPTSSKTII